MWIRYRRTGGVPVLVSFRQPMPGVNKFGIDKSNVRPKAHRRGATHTWYCFRFFSCSGGVSEGNFAQLHAAQYFWDAISGSDSKEMLLLVWNPKNCPRVATGHYVGLHDSVPYRATLICGRSVSALPMLHFVFRNKIHVLLVYFHSNQQEKQSLTVNDRNVSFADNVKC